MYSPKKENQGAAYRQQGLRGRRGLRPSLPMGGLKGLPVGAGPGPVRTPGSTSVPDRCAFLRFGAEASLLLGPWLSSSNAGAALNRRRTSAMKTPFLPEQVRPKGFPRDPLLRAKVLAATHSLPGRDGSRAILGITMNLVRRASARARVCHVPILREVCLSYSTVVARWFSRK